MFNELGKQVKEAVRKNQGDGLLLSGGINSGILAYLSLHAKDITVSLEGQGDDLRFVSILRGRLDLNLIPVNVTIAEALTALRDVIRILESFDPALPNDLAVYFGMREAKRQGLSSMMNGDGGEEQCPGCGTGMPKGKRHCRVCGWVP